MRIEDVIEELEQKKNNLRFDYLVRVCQEYFGKAKVTSSHHHFITTWPDDPLINLQKRQGQAKPYQVKQVVKALRKFHEIAELKTQRAREEREKKGEVRHANKPSE